MIRRHVKLEFQRAGKLPVLKGTTTIGSFVAHKHAKKVYRIDQHIAMTIAGVVGDAQAIVEMLRANSALYKLDLARPIPINSAARLVSNVLFQSRYYTMGVQALIG